MSSPQSKLDRYCRSKIKLEPLIHPVVSVELFKSNRANLLRTQRIKKQFLISSTIKMETPTHRKIKTPSLNRPKLKPTHNYTESANQSTQPSPNLKEDSSDSGESVVWDDTDLYNRGLKDKLEQLKPSEQLAVFFKYRYEQHPNRRTQLSTSKLQQSMDWLTKNKRVDQPNPPYSSQCQELLNQSFIPKHLERRPSLVSRFFIQ